MAETPKAKAESKPEVVEVKTDSLDKVATAINSMVAAREAKSLPMFGLPPVEGSEPCRYFDRDGKEHPAVLEGGKFNPRSWPVRGEDPMSTTGIKNTGHCIAFNIRVNFKVKNADNWVPITGIYQKKDQRNGYRKAFIVLTEEQEKKYALTFTPEKKVVLPLPPGITL